MDKETLSNYGWIVIAVLVLAVMVALATPFGHFIENGVKSTAQGLFDVQQSAGAIAGLDIPDQAIAEPGENNSDDSTPQDGDTYEYGDYKYIYETSSNGWRVAINENVTDTNQTTYGAILESINGEPVTSLYSTFEGCTALTTAPVIPSSVTDMTRTFWGCTNLTTAPVIPSSVTNMTATFNGCTSLTTAPVIPSSVTDMTRTFRECTSLETAPVIPSSVTNMSHTFRECTSLETAPVIPSNVTDMTQTFYGCTSLKTYAGSTDADGDFSNYVIPSSVTSLSSTFRLCTSLVIAPDMRNSTSVTNMDHTFRECTSLTTAPVIPSSVTSMMYTFRDSPSLTGTIEINATNLTSYHGCFLLAVRPTTVKSITFTGTCPQLAELAATATYSNVTVQQ